MFLDFWGLYNVLVVIKEKYILIFTNNYIYKLWVYLTIDKVSLLSIFVR